ncbi:MAG TPA: hypothetical protein VI094_19805 [Propionibacteriaceae bacterium]
MRRITKAVLGGFAGCALVLGGTQVASGALSDTYKVTDALTDLLSNDGPFDSARAKTTIVKTPDGGTDFALRVTGIDPSEVPDGGYGAHLHVNSCDNELGPGGHYRDKPELGGIPENEVWFSLLPDEEGMAYTRTSASFVPVDVDGEMSIVIHVGPAAAGGDKQACFPLDVSGIFPTERSPSESRSPTE